jgi:hypothetical protein
MGRLRLLGCYFAFAGFPMGLFAGSFWLASVGSVGLFRAAIEVGAFFNSQILMVNIAYHVRLRLERHIAALNGALHPYRSPPHAQQ